MAARFLWLTFRPDCLEAVLAVLEEVPSWRVHSDDNWVHFVVSVDSSKVDRILQPLDDVMGEDSMLSLQAPLRQEPEPPREREKQRNEGPIPAEELLATIERNSITSGAYVLFIALSVVIAFFGLHRSDAVLLIGSMITAPLMGPIVALAYALMWKKGELMKRSLSTLVVGALLTFSLSYVLGLIAEGTLSSSPARGAAFVNGDGALSPAMEARNDPNWGDLILALAAGVLGAVSLTTSTSSALVGVMIALALLPPMVASGIFLEMGRVQDAMGALLLATVNGVAILWTASLTFAVQFHRTNNQPLRWLAGLLALLIALLAIWQLR